MGFEFLDEKIFIKKNVLSNQYMEKVLSIVSNLSESDWLQHGNYEVGDLPKGSFIQDKVSPPIDLVNQINDIVTDLFVPEYWPIRNLFINRLRKEEKPLLQTVNTVSSNGEKEFHLDYISTIPMGNWKGGEYTFPKKNITISGIDEFKKYDLIQTFEKINLVLMNGLYYTNIKGGGAEDVKVLYII
jgi:hypothetical protein